MAVKSGIREGHVVRTERSFRQDAELAMGSDPIRAIVELVTNADDAYVSVIGKRKGQIRIEIDRGRQRPSTIVVKDRARGMTLPDMEDRLGHDGVRSSGFEAGQDVRGLLGRGAKDCVAFGRIQWTSSHGGSRSEFRLFPTGRFELESLGEAEPSTTGTTATLTVERRFSIKHHATLKELLERHYALRPCLSDREGRDVRLLDQGQDREDHLVYEAPVGVEVAKAVVEVPGFPAETAEVRLFRAEAFLDDGKDREYWRHGLLVTSGRAAYDVFGGKFEREPWSQCLGWLYGEVRCEGIAKLIRQYDDALEAGQEPPASNPIRLVTRNRRGLVDRSEHPFLESLYRAVEEFLEPHVIALRQELEGAAEHARVGDDLGRRLRELGKVLGELFREEEADMDSAEGSTGAQVPDGLTIIPDVRVVRPGSPARFSVRFKPATALPPTWPAPSARLRLVGGDGELDSDGIRLIDRGAYFSGSFVIRDIPEGALAEAAVEVEGHEATCLAESRLPTSPAPVPHLSFERQSYRLKPSEPRRLLLLAPWDLVVDEPEVQLTAKNSGFVVAKSSSWAFDEPRQCGALAVTVRGRRIGQSGKVTAEVAAQSADCSLSVEGVSASAVQVDLTERKYPQRALWDGDILRVVAGDRSIARYLGPASRNSPGQKTIHFRTALAEIVAFHCARRVLQDRVRTGRPPTMSDLYRSHMELEQKFLPKIHAVLVRPAELSGTG